MMRWLVFAAAGILLTGCQSAPRLEVPDPVAPAAYRPELQRVELLAAVGDGADEMVRWLSSSVAASGRFEWSDRRQSGWSGSEAAWPGDALGLEIAVVAWDEQSRGARIDAEYWSSHGGPGRRVSDAVAADSAWCELAVTLVLTNQRVQQRVQVRLVAVPEPRERGVVYRPADRQALVVSGVDDLREAAGRQVVAQLTALFTPSSTSQSIALASEGDDEAQALALSGDLMAAEAWLRRLVSTAQAQPADLYNLGLVLEAQGYHADALPFYKAALEARPQRRDWRDIFHAAAERSTAAAALSSDPLDQAL